MYKRKICIITPELPYPNNSGGRIYHWERIKLLNKLGYEIILFSLKEKNEIVEYDELRKYCRDIFIYERDNKVISALKKIWIPFSVATRTVDDMRSDIKEYIENNSIELLIIDHINMCDNCIGIKCKKIITQHNIENLAFKSMYQNSSSFLKKIIYRREYLLMRLYERKIYNSKKVEGYTFISSEDRKIFEKKYNNTITELVPMGINVESDKIESSENIEKDSICYVGKMDYEPNVQACVRFVRDILPMIKKVIPNVKFYIVGKNPIEDIMNLQNEKGVVVTGMVKDTKEYINKCQLVVIPLKSGGGVKIKLFEALSLKKIVITTKKGIEGTNFMHKNDVLVADDDTEFAKLCIEVLKDTKSFENIARQGYIKLLNEYSWESIGFNYNRFINTIIGDN